MEVGTHPLTTGVYTIMSQQRTYSFSKDNEVALLRFEKFVLPSERSTIVASLMLDYVNTHSPDKKALKAQREKDRIEAEERLAKLMSIDKAEADAVLKDNEVRQKQLLEAQEYTQQQHFFDSCKKQSKILVNVEFGLDPLVDIVPSKWDNEKRDSYRARWKELTERLINDKK